MNKKSGVNKGDPINNQRHGYKRATKLRAANARNFLLARIGTPADSLSMASLPCFLAALFLEISLPPATDGVILPTSNEYLATSLVYWPSLQP
jgi:hypothetical protein